MKTNLLRVITNSERNMWKSHCEKMRVGAALTAFFTWVSIISRKTPAPCPCCHNDVVWGGSDGEPVECPDCGLCGPFDSETREDGESDCCQMWNSFAVPLAFERAKECSIKSSAASNEMVTP